ncbi:MAG: sulfurtransferase TusA family protein [Pseudomonadota bacterium]
MSDAGLPPSTTLTATPRPTPDHVLDTSGLKCPLPVLKARKALQTMAAGGVLEMWADDTAALIDVPHFCAEQGHVLLDQADETGANGPVLVFWLAKAATS